ncbi:hypothetical protein [Butyrivibrio sp. FC2001]|uniref:hypothetical protein n=1 Tax=Butyrivibrio sp. FC2001 TaxID=1280671 RepID=UPI00040C143F|nr:hypothetical protein [Butyrivibrio sp. FC2001]
MKNYDEMSDNEIDELNRKIDEGAKKGHTKIKWMSNYNLKDFIKNNYSNRDHTNGIILEGNFSFYYCENCGAELYWCSLDVKTNYNFKSSEKSREQQLKSAIKACESGIGKFINITCGHDGCPVCSAKRDPKKFDEQAGAPLYMGFVDDFSCPLDANLSEFDMFIKRTFETMRLDRMEYTIPLDQENAAKEVKQCLLECQKTINNTPDKSLSNNIKTMCKTTEGLSQYLLKATELESNIYSIEERLLALYTHSQEAKREARISKYSIEEELLSERNNIIAKYDSEYSRIKSDNFGINLLPMPSMPSAPTPVMRQEPVEPFYDKPGLFNRKKVEARNTEKKQDYLKELEQYNREVKQYTIDTAEYEKQLAEYSLKLEEIKKHNTEAEKNINEARASELANLNSKKEQELSDLDNSTDVTTPQILADDLIEEEIATAKETYIKLLQIKADFYSPGIVYVKYRNLPAISMFYEYISSGRCDSLNGDNGAYNLYESELRSDLILSKLDIVIEKLDELQQTQYTLCNIMNTAISTLNNIDKNLISACDYLKQIESTGTKVLRQTTAIKNNTAITAYYAEKTAFYSKMDAMLNLASFIGL